MKRNRVSTMYFDGILNVLCLRSLLEFYFIRFHDGTTTYHFKNHSKITSIAYAFRRTVTLLFSGTKSDLKLKFGRFVVQRGLYWITNLHFPDHLCSRDNLEGSF